MNRPAPERIVAILAEGAQQRGKNPTTGPEHYIKLVKLSEQDEEHLGWLLDDDLDQLTSIRELIGFCIRYKHLFGPTKSAEKRDQALHVVELADALAAHLEKHFPWSDVKGIRKLQESYLSLALYRDPDGKPSERNHAQKYIADALCFRIAAGELLVEPHISPKSDLAKVFRICCRSTGIKAPTNVAHYLSDPVSSIPAKKKLIKYLSICDQSDRFERRPELTDQDALIEQEKQLAMTHELFGFSPRTESWPRS